MAVAGTEWDVGVVGAGPAGPMAAATAAAAGCRTVLVERAAIPRYKTCGGGLLGTSTRASRTRAECPCRAR